MRKPDRVPMCSVVRKRPRNQSIKRKLLNPLFTKVPITPVTWGSEGLFVTIPVTRATMHGKGSYPATNMSVSILTMTLWDEP